MLIDTRNGEKIPYENFNEGFKEAVSRNVAWRDKMDDFEAAEWPLVDISDPRTLERVSAGRHPVWKTKELNPDEAIFSGDILLPPGGEGIALESHVGVIDQYGHLLPPGYRGIDPATGAESYKAFDFQRLKALVGDDLGSRIQARVEGGEQLSDVLAEATEGKYTLRYFEREDLFPEDVDWRAVGNFSDGEEGTAEAKAFLTEVEDRARQLYDATRNLDDQNQ